MRLSIVKDIHVGRWYLRLLSNGTVILVSQYRNRVNSGHVLEKDARLVDMMHCPAYLHRAVKELRDG